MKRAKLGRMRRETVKACPYSTLGVIVRLVRNCALGRTIQYSETVMLEPSRYGVLDSRLRGNDSVI